MYHWVIAVDLDKCLLNSSNTLSDQNLKSLEEAASSGAVIIIASGRMVSAIQPICDQLPAVAAIVAFNGAMVLNVTDGKVLLEVTLLETEIIRLLLWCVEQNCQVIFCCLDSIYVTFIDPVVEEYVRRTQVPVNVCKDPRREMLSPVYKALIYRRPPEPTNEAILIDEMRYSGAAPNCTLLKSDHGYVEVVPAGVAKDKGIKVALTAIGLQHIPLIAIGDGENDIGMLRFADCGYAVANACAEAREAADIIVSDCDNNGVAEAIYHFMANFPSSQFSKGDLTDDFK